MNLQINQNGMSHHARNVAIVNALTGLVIGIGLSCAILIPSMRGAERTAISRYKRLQSESAMMVSHLASENAMMRAVIADLNDRFELFATLKANGWDASTPAEARRLMEELSHLPLGSPFSNGHRITSEYGAYTLEQFGWTGVNHPGIDLIPLNGDRNIYAPAEATVVDFGVSTLWGKYITLETSSGYQMFFAHLEKIFWQDFDGDGAWSLSVGDIIPARTRIAVMGSTGRYATGAHLHYEIRTNDGESWVPMNPKAIAGYSGAIDEGGTE